MLLLIFLSDLLQAIASMVRARDADPSNLEVLLALGVSHTNGMRALVTLSLVHPSCESGCLLLSSMDFNLMWWVV
jgi:hypothetical protein